MFRSPAGRGVCDQVEELQLKWASRLLVRVWRLSGISGETAPVTTEAYLSAARLSSSSSKASSKRCESETQGTSSMSEATLASARPDLSTKCDRWLKREDSALIGASCSILVSASGRT